MQCVNLASSISLNSLGNCKNTLRRHVTGYYRAVRHSPLLMYSWYNVHGGQHQNSAFIIINNFKAGCTKERILMKLSLRVLTKRFIGIFLMAMKPVVSNIGYYGLLHLLHTLSSIC